MNNKTKTKTRKLKLISYLNIICLIKINIKLQFLNIIIYIWLFYTIIIYKIMFNKIILNSNQINNLNFIEPRKLQLNLYSAA